MVSSRCCTIWSTVAMRGREDDDIPEEDDDIPEEDDDIPEEDEKEPETLEAGVALGAEGPSLFQFTYTKDPFLGGSDNSQKRGREEGKLERGESVCIPQIERAQERVVGNLQRVPPLREAQLLVSRGDTPLRLHQSADVFHGAMLCGELPPGGAVGSANAQCQHL